MTVLAHYLQKHQFSAPQINETPSKKLGIIVVIPCYNEENITGILQSLYECDQPQCDVEVQVVLNSPEDASTEVIERNAFRKKDFEEWKKTHSSNKVRFYMLNFPSLPSKDAGVGLARKLGMDEATARFMYIGKEQGIIANIDSDCTCSKNYLVEMEKLFKNPKIKACSIRFEHPVEGNEFTLENYQSIIQYELYLHYYVLSFRNTGHPFAYHTIGSSFAVRANVYAMQGGMNKRKAGEDFYFLQKVIPLGYFAELNTACVYPSPRPSVRVPFGTGATIEKMLKTNNYQYYTYNIMAFEDLKIFFTLIEKLYATNKAYKTLEYIKGPLKPFLIKNEFPKRLEEILKNTTSLKSFMLRFYRWFNAFIVLKYMNYSHENFYQRQPVAKMAQQYLEKHYSSTIDKNISDKEMLFQLRAIMYKI